MIRIAPGSSCIGAALPLVVFGLGPAAAFPPATATVLAAVDDRQPGIASEVDTAVARTAQLAAVAAPPLAVGLGDEDYNEPAALTSALDVAMVITAAMSAVGALTASAGHPQRRAAPAFRLRARRGRAHRRAGRGPVPDPLRDRRATGPHQRAVATLTPPVRR